ncbi:WD repeat-containing protein 46 [Halocaridina rubra]|uniref:WD repeat-containing protein 46 n=1 Tax=Halocaridina rubra TaxID=373956 RepID=A0AAN8ZSW0_HALRR
MDENNREHKSNPSIKGARKGNVKRDGGQFKRNTGYRKGSNGNPPYKANTHYRDSSNFKSNRRPDMFPGRKVLDPRLRDKYSWGEGVNMAGVRKRSWTRRKRLENKEARVKEAEEEAARAEVLLTENTGLMEANEGTYTSHVAQTDIRDSVDITSATKSFDLKLDQFGPYKMQFTRNGRHLMLGGRMGHLASFDWMTKKLHCEINVMESIHDICWLHTEQMMAVAQKKWVYIYDNQGTELHCLKKLCHVLKMEFLPYHFLLCAGGEVGFLSWLDISLGREVIQTYTKKGRLDVMTQNPYNAVICCGHANGTISMWTPNMKTPVATVLCHAQSLRAIEFDPSGRYFATAGVNREIKLWDARNLGESMHTYRVGSGASTLAFSQKKLLAVAMGNVVEVYDGVTTGAMNKPYMRHRCNSAVTGMQFCPYEDVLGVSTYSGYSSLLIPGAGEPNFDALESNPYLSVSGRREAEVKALLGKVPPELITLDPQTIGQVNVPRLEEKLEAKRKLMYIRVPNIDVTPRYRMKGKSGSAKKFKRKQRAEGDKKREYLKEAIEHRDNLGLNKMKKKKERKKGTEELLDRFKPKTLS